LRAAVAAGGTPVPPRPVSVRPSDFMVRTAVPRMPPLDPSELQARPRRVLVADDARVVRVKLQRLLAAQGWQVIEAADGEEALRALGTHAPDLLITDVDMPGLDGFALTRALRAQAATAQLPVVMITAADDQHREEAVRAGVTVLLGKPYGEAALLSHLRRLMGLPAVAVAIEAVPA
jgi:CheY-like chemotaxis protein